MTSPIARLRALDPRVFDRAVAAAFVIGSAAEMAFFAADATDFVVGAVAAAGMASLVVRRRRPIVPLAVITSTTVLAALAAPFVIERLAAPYVGLMVALYSLGRYQGRGAGPAIVVVLAAIVVATSITDQFDFGQVFWLGIVGAGPFLIGRAVRNRTRLQAELRARTEQLERDRERRAERAVADERARLAGELQALIANSVSAMVVQAEVVPRAVGAGDTPAAERTLAAIESTGRDALTEMRRLLGVLRPPEDERASLVPQPTLAQVEGLAERARREGMEVEVTFEGEPVALSPGPDLAAYRVVQDALEAAAGGGAANARVVVRFEEDALELDVSDDRGGASSPESLGAMRERLGLYGGRVRAGDDDDGYRVLARMPLNGAGS